MSRQRASTSVNVAADLGVCGNCNEAFSVSRLVAAGGMEEDFDPSNPPPGAWFEETAMGWRVGATTRSAIAFFLVPFMCVWSGFSLGGIYGSQIIQGEFNLIFSLFGLPFLAGSVLFGSIAAMTVCGKHVVSVDGNDGRVFTGIGPIGRTRRFDWSSIATIDEDTAYSSRGMPQPSIALTGQSRLKFGSMMSDARRYFVLQALRRMLAERDGRM